MPADADASWLDVQDARDAAPDLGDADGGDDPEIGPPDVEAPPDTLVSTPDVELPEDVGNELPPVVDASDAPDAADPPPIFVVGTNAGCASDPSGFLETTGDIPVVFGPQGAWMVVVAIATDAFPETPYIDVRAGVKATGDPFEAALTLKRQKVTLGDDGLSYLVNVWLVLDSSGDAAPWKDKEVTYSVEIEPCDPDGTCPKPAFGGTAPIVSGSVTGVLREEGTCLINGG